VLFELVEGAPSARAAPNEPGSADDVTAESVLSDSDGDVKRHGAGKGSRWPALLIVLVLLAVAAVVLWWSFLR
jgi:hypothetical protein